MRTLRPLSVGEVLDTTIGVYREAFVPLLMLTIVTQGISLLWGSFTTIDELLSQGLLVLLARLLLVVSLGAVGSAASTFIVSETYLGRSITMTEALRRAVPLIGRIFMVGVSVSLVSALGFMFLIVPGIVIFCGLLLATPALVIESLPSAGVALSRSWKLTAGLRGRVFVILFVGALLLYLPLVAISTLSAVLAGEGGVAGMSSIIFILISSALQLLMYPFFYVATVVLYYDAKVRKEGFDLELLAQTLLPA